MGTLQLDYHHSERAPRPRRNYIVIIACAIAGLLIPLGSFITARGGSPLSPDWQDGEPFALIRVQLESKVAWPFFPLLAFSMCGMFSALFLPRKAAKSRVVRVGVYSGVVLAAQYSIIMGFALGKLGLLIGYAIASVAGVAVVLILAIIAKFIRANLLWGIVVPCCGVGALLALNSHTGREFLGSMVLVALGAGPPWALAAYLWVSIALWRQQNEPAATHNAFFNLLLFGWITAYIVAWRLAIVEAMRFYSALPTTQPSRCYVCTAAANGHSLIVRSTTICLEDGTLMRVNDQLRNLKCAELALKAVAPAAHRRLRMIYDCIGPRLARWISNPLAADIAYLSLKPAEWMCRAVFRLVSRDLLGVVRSLYRQ